MIKASAPRNSILIKLLIIGGSISVLSACGNPQQVVFKSSGTTETFSQGQSAIPKDFENLVYPDATTAGSVSAEGDSNNEQSKFLMLSSKSPVDKVSKWYQDQLKKENWKMNSPQEQPKLISLTGHKDGTELNIMITEDNGATSISLSIAQQSEGAYNEENHENELPNKTTPPTD